MNSNEFWEGYHSFKANIRMDGCPYRSQPNAKEWKRGWLKAQSESN